MKTLVIVPTYDERENIASLIARVLSSGNDGIHLLVIDDSSPDGTGAVVDELISTHPGRLFVQHRPMKMGIGSAYMQGFRFAVSCGYDAVCEMDADGSHDASALVALIDVVGRGIADVSVGSRRVSGGVIHGWGMHRHGMSAAASGFARAILGFATRDVTSGFRCYSADVIRSLLAQEIASDGYAFQEETLFHCERLCWSVRELPIVFRDRESGTSKLSWREVPSFFATIIRLRLAYGRIRRGGA